MKDKRLIVIFFTVFIDLVGFGIIIPLNPYLAEKFGASPLMVGLLMSIYSLMQFLFSPIWGQLSDRYGRRPIILISLLGGAIAHTWFGFADSLLALIFARAFAGMFGGNISTAMAYIADITDEKNRSKGMGMVGAAFGLGFILGPVIGGIFGIVGKNLGSEPPFGESFPALIAAGICFANFLLALKVLPESRKFGQQSNVVRGHRFARIWTAFTTPVLGVLMLLVFINGLAMALIEAPLFLLAQDKFQWTAWTASFGFGYIGVIMVFTQGYLIRKLLPKVGERNLLIAGLVLSGVGFALVTVSSTVPLLALAVTALGLGNGLVNPSLNGSVSLVSGEEVQGNNLGVSQSLASLSRILGPAAGGALYGHVGMESPFAGAAVLAAIGFAIAWVMRGKLPDGARAMESGAAKSGSTSKVAVALETPVEKGPLAMEIGLFQLENLSLMPASQFSFFDLRKQSIAVDPQIEALLKKGLPLNADDVVKHLEKSDKGAPIVLVCENGKTSTEVARRLDAAGFTNLYVVRGGVSGLVSEL